MPTELDIAAGGLLESGEGDQLVIAVVHRGRYDDWALPKGHLDPGETLEQAALREVEEETGCSGEIVETVKPIAYLVKGQPKVVIFYRMRLTERGDLAENDEVSEVRWLRPAEASELMSYESERELVTSVYSLT